jgi:hypothetical protein
MRKWQLIEKAISFQKIDGTKISNISERDDTFGNGNLFRRKTVINTNSSNSNLASPRETHLFDLFVYLSLLKY